MSLAEQIASAKRTVVTDSLSFSINEFVGMYVNGEINIHPAFQRMFRWGPEQQANLIESILIGIPLPSFFVYEREDGVWELVDGLQRISTILKFFGELKSPEGAKVAPGTLTKTKYLPGLDGAVWDKSNAPARREDAEIFELDNSHKLFIKRSRVNVEVLKQPSSPDAKFDLFQRLNRGGAIANEQEVRTCFMVMKDPEFANLVSDLADDERFKGLCRISDDGVLKQLHLEYMTRLLCHAFYDLLEGEDLNEFLDRSLEILMDRNDDTKIQERVDSVIGWVYEACGVDGLIPTSGRKIFTVRGLESVLVGLTRNYEAISALDDPRQFVKERVEAFWADPSNQIFTSSGMSSADRTKKTIPLGEQWFRP